MRSVSFILISFENPVVIGRIFLFRIIPNYQKSVKKVCHETKNTYIWNTKSIKNKQK